MRLGKAAIQYKYYCGEAGGFLWRVESVINSGHSSILSFFSTFLASFKKEGGWRDGERAKQLGPCHLAPVACPGALSMECSTSNFEFSHFSRYHTNTVISDCGCRAKTYLLVLRHRIVKYLVAINYLAAWISQFDPLQNPEIS
jgi:hypothetical protein